MIHTGMVVEMSEVLAAIFLGLAGSGHCLGMCGGISTAIGVGTSGSQSETRMVAYHFGRILSYGLLGAAMGAAAGVIDLPYWRIGLRYAAGIMLIAMGLYTLNWWKGLVYLERAGKILWNPVQQLARPLLPANSPLQAMGLGAVWGFLPCGLVYSALTWSAMHGDAIKGAYLMGLFGLGTVPVMLTASIGAHWMTSVLKASWFKSSVGLMLIAWGVFNILMISNHH